MFNTFLISVLLTDINFLNYILYFLNYAILFTALGIPFYTILNIGKNAKLGVDNDFDGNKVGLIIFMIIGVITVTAPIF